MHILQRPCMFFAMWTQRFLSSQSSLKLKIVLTLPTYWGFALCTIITVTNVVPLSDICHRTWFEGLKLDVASVAPTSQVLWSAILLVLIVVMFDLQRWDVIHWHTVRAKFRDNLFVVLKDAKVLRGSAGTCTCGDELSSYLRNEDRLICTLAFKADLLVTCCVEAHCHSKRLNHV
jgi:hypothetical protein